MSFLKHLKDSTVCQTEQTLAILPKTTWTVLGVIKDWSFFLVSNKRSHISLNLRLLPRMYSIVSKEKGVWKNPFLPETNLKNSNACCGLEWEKRTLFRTLSAKSFESGIWEVLREFLRDCGVDEVVIMRKTWSMASFVEGQTGRVCRWEYRLIDHKRKWSWGFGVRRSIAELWLRRNSMEIWISRIREAGRGGRRSKGFNIQQLKSSQRERRRLVGDV